MKLKDSLEDSREIQLKERQQAIKEKISLDGKKGRKIYSKLNEPLSNYLYTYFEILYPGNGQKMLMMWIQALQTVRGQPAGLIILGLPGEGKSVMMETVLECIPPEHIYHIDNATESGFFGLIQEDGAHFPDKKIMYLGDLGSDDTYKRTETIRYHIRKLMTDGKTGDRVTRDREDQEKTIKEYIYGYPSLWFSTVKGEIQKQERDRSIIITPSLEHSSKVAYIQKHTRGKSRSETAKYLYHLKQKWIPRFQKIFNHLIYLDYEIVFPYNLEDQELDYRDNNKIIDIVSGNALLNWRWRQHTEELIIAKEEDIFLAQNTLTPDTPYTKGDLSDKSLKYLNEIYMKVGLDTFDISDVMNILEGAYKNTQAATTSLIKPAIKKGYIKITYQGRPNKYQFNREIKNIPKNYNKALNNLKVQKEEVYYERGIKYEDKKLIPLGFVKEIPLPLYLKDV